MAVYCTCLRDRVQGWTKQGDDWVCTKCRKPSKKWVEKVYIPRLLENNKNEQAT